MLWLCYKMPSGLFGINRDTSVIHEKAKIVCFNFMQPQKMKFKSVQINMKHRLIFHKALSEYYTIYTIFRDKKMISIFTHQKSVVIHEHKKQQHDS